MKYLIFIFFVSIIGCQSSNTYVEEIEQWRLDRVEKLTAPIGWASLSGLHWINQDTMFIGGSEHDIVFDDKLDEAIGAVIKTGDELNFVSSVPGINESDKEVELIPIKTDQDEVPSRFSYKQWEWTFIERGGKTGLRVWDTLHINRSKYIELDYYPIDPNLNILAEFHAYDPPLEKSLQNVLGMTVAQVVPGELRFKINGQEQSLQVLSGTEDEFFIIFSDGTTGGDTYGGGRYLYSPKPTDGSTSCYIDFNKAYTPPCGFTEFATCLLPTQENTLLVEIEAGEMYHFDH